MTTVNAGQEGKIIRKIPVESRAELAAKDLGDMSLRKKIHSECRVEVIEPDYLRPTQLYDYIQFRQGQEGGLVKTSRQLTRGTQDALANALVARMTNAPIRLAIMRYLGDDNRLENGVVLKTGQVVASNESKQTFVYPPDMFRNMMRLKDGYSMDNMSEAFTDASGKHPFRTFPEIRDLAEGHARPGEGVGFLILALVDDRLRGLALSKPLLESVLRYHRDTLRHDYVFAYGRLPQLGGKDGEGEDNLNKVRGRAQESFRKHGVVETEILNEYLRGLKAGDGRDWGYQFHRRAGCTPICGIPFSYQDPKSFNTGFLAVYDIKKITREERI